MAANKVNAGARSAGAQALDREHLWRQTMGDEALARELTDLFLAQSATLLALIAQEGVETARRDAAHTLKGAASAIGAWNVASQAAAVESAVSAAPERLAHEIGALAAAIADSQVAIRQLFRAAARDEPSKSA